MGSTPRAISGSRAAAILGLSEFVTTFSVWQEIREEIEPGWNLAHGYSLPVREESANLRWGLAFENAVIELAERADPAHWVACREKAFARPVGVTPAVMTCHVDGIFCDHEMALPDDPAHFTIHEGKTTNARSFHEKWGEPGTNRVPQSYQIQAQHNMMVSGASRCIISVLVFPKMVDEWERAGWTVQATPSGYALYHEKRGVTTPASWARLMDEMGNFHQYTIEADAELQARLRDMYADFWSRFVAGDEVPTPGCYDDVRRAFPKPVGTLVADDQVARWCLEHAEIGEEISASGRLGKRRDELKTLILNWARGQDPAVDDESRDKTIIRDSQGKKLASWNGKTFR